MRTLQIKAYEAGALRFQRLAGRHAQELGDGRKVVVALAADYDPAITLLVQIGDESHAILLSDVVAALAAPETVAEPEYEEVTA